MTFSKNTEFLKGEVDEKYNFEQIPVLENEIDDPEGFYHRKGSRVIYWFERE